MKRKIVQHGSSSLTITLPIKWVQKYNIKKGSDLNVEESGPTLIISTDQERYTQKKELSTSETGIFTKNELSHLYQLGYDEIEVRYSDRETLEEIKKRLPECIGYEIIDQKNGKVFIKSIASTLESEFDNLLRKSFLITNELARGILEVFEKKQYDRLAEIRNMENLNNKFTDVCIRILNKRGYKEQKKTMQAYEIVKSIERIADEFKYICDLFTDSKTTLSKERIILYRDVINYYLMFYEIFYKFSPELKRELYANRKNLIKRISEELLKSKGKESLFLHNLMNIVQKSYEGAGAYFSLIL